MVITDGQVRKLRQLLEQRTPLAIAAGRTGMSDKTARHYRDHPAFVAAFHAPTAHASTPSPTFGTRCRLSSKPSRAEAPGQDALRMAPSATSRSVPRFPQTHLRASRSPVAGRQRTGQTRHLPTGASRRLSRGCNWGELWPAKLNPSNPSPTLLLSDGKDERIAKYERHLHNLLTSTLHELERLQARRQGESVPPPVVADVNVIIENGAT